jgi:hypothetical protein
LFFRWMLCGRCACSWRVSVLECLANIYISKWFLFVIIVGLACRCLGDLIIVSRGKLVDLVADVVVEEVGLFGAGGTLRRLDLTFSH